MSILRAMQTGVSGIAAEGEALSVVGDNIANSNTVGFKEQRAIFSDMLGREVSSMPGMGVKVSTIDQMFTQGSLSNTGVSTDLALSGDGFFVVKGNMDGISGNFYTRAGQMKMNNEGYLVNSNGLEVQGYVTQPDGKMAAGASSLKVPTSSISPKPTQSVSVTANLTSKQAVITDPWDVNNPSKTSNYPNSITTYDSLGAPHTIDLYFRKTADNAWEWHALAPGGDLAGGTAGTFSEVGNGTLTFDGSGKLLDSQTTTPITADFAGATPQQVITTNFGKSITGGGSGSDGITQYLTPESSTSSQSQDGYASGELSGVAVDSTGTLRGLYTNGQKLAIGQIAVAKFQSNQGLGRAGNNLWIDTLSSGTPALGVAGAGGRGSISAGTLEQSNVELADQFVNLITHQRAFQANSKTITTADEMLQELVNLKR